MNNTFNKWINAQTQCRHNDNKYALTYCKKDFNQSNYIIRFMFELLSFSEKENIAKTKLKISKAGYIRVSPGNWSGLDGCAHVYESRLIDS